LGQAEARRRYDRGAEHAPHHLTAQSQLLQQLCPKWGGSLEQAYAFARACASAAPPGSSNGKLVADAHAELFFVLDFRAARKYLRQSEVQRELQELAERTVLHADVRKGFSWVAAHNSFAAMFSLAGNHRAAAPHFRALGHLASELPWVYFDEPVRLFAKHRSTALRKG
jgi:hypothetical protein